MVSSILFFVSEVVTTFIDGVLELAKGNDRIVYRVNLTTGIDLLKVAVVLFKGLNNLRFLLGHFLHVAHEVTHPKCALILIFIG